MARSTQGRGRRRGDDRMRRKAVQEAKAEADAERRAAERRQQTVLGIIVVAVVVALIAVAGFAIWRANRPTSSADVQKAYTAVQNVADKPSAATDKGGFLLSKNGLDKKVAGAPTVEVYMDFMCPGCGQFERTMGSTLSTMVNAGQLNLEIHPNAFLDSLSTDQYSTRAASFVASVAQHDPAHALALISAMYAENFQPSESSYKPVSNDAIKKLAISVGVKSTVADQAAKGEYQEWIGKISAYTPLRKELWNVSGSNKGTMTTPTVVINGSYWDINQLSTQGIDYLTGFLKSIGLNQNQVGQAGQMPSIGANGKPIAL